MYIMKSKFTQRIKQFFDNIKQIKIDKQMRKEFLKDIQKEIADPKSKFNQFHLSTDENFNSITAIVSIPENYQLASNDAMKYQKLQELIKPINLYIGNTICWGEYFKAPNFYYIDEIDDEKQDNQILEEVSCSYVVEWKYAPVLDKYPNFKKEFAAFCTLNTALVGGLIALLIVLL